MLPEIKYQEKCCHTCKYYRWHRTCATASECLFLGRTLSIADRYTEYLLIDWDRGRYCDGWKKRPKNWNIISEGAENNPHWKDPYISKVSQERIRKRLKGISKCV